MGASEAAVRAAVAVAVAVAEGAGAAMAANTTVNITLQNELGSMSMALERVRLDPPEPPTPAGPSRREVLPPRAARGRLGGGGHWSPGGSARSTSSPRQRRSTLHVSRGCCA
jgi:hypothetical protein